MNEGKIRLMLEHKPYNVKTEKGCILLPKRHNEDYYLPHYIYVWIILFIYRIFSDR